MARHFPTSLNDPAPPKLSQDILETPRIIEYQSTHPIGQDFRPAVAKYGLIFGSKDKDSLTRFCRLNYALGGGFVFPIGRGGGL